MTDASRLPAPEPLLELREVMARLRAECAWKREQTHESLLPYLAEESAEVAEAVHEGDPGHLCEELGDLLLQVYFHASVAAEAGEFTIDDVAGGIVAKMRRRNPHVFGSPEERAEAAGLSAAEIDRRWEQIKRAGG